MQNRPRHAGFQHSQTGRGISAARLRAILIIGAFLEVMIGGGRALGQCSYSVEIIQAPYCEPFGHPPTTGVAVNSNGDVVGNYQSCVIGPRKAFLWTKEDGFQPLPDIRMPHTEMYASDINDHRVIVGGVSLNDVGFRGFVLEDGVYTILPPGFDEFGPISGAGSINNAGIVAGQRSVTREYQPRNAFVWSKDMGFIDLGLMGYETDSSVGDISETGIVSGTAGSISNGEGYIWDDGSLYLLGIPKGGIATAVGGIGNSRIAGVVIYPDNDGGIQGVPSIWTAQDGWSSIGLLPACEVGNARDASESTDEVVGFCTTESGDRHAFVWYGDIMRDLNDLVPSGGSFSIERAFAISNNGQIVADGHVPGATVTFLLTPIARSSADTNGDCDTDFDDFTFLLSAWGLNEPRADFDEDGIVDFDDFVLLLANWTFDP